MSVGDKKITELEIATDLTGASFVIAKPSLNERVPAAVLKNLLDLDLVDNTPDASKPISTATQAALDLKADQADMLVAQADITALQEDVATFVSISDGDKGDIVVSGTGATWTIDPAVLSAFGRTLIDDATASDVLSTLGFSNFIKGLIDDADAATALSTLGISAFAQTLLDDLSAAAVLTTLGASANGQSLITAADYAAMRALLDLEAGTDFYSIAAANAAFQPLDADLTALAALGSTGIAVRTAANTWAQRTLTGTANQVTVTNGDGVSGNPTISLPAAVTLTDLTINGDLRLPSTGDASLSSTAHPFQIGPTTGLNLIIDINEVMARNNGAASDLNLNFDGGNVILGGSTSTVTIAGTLELGAGSIDEIAYGTYTPTLTSVTNIASSTAYSTHYCRIGDMVIVTGRILIDPTASGTATEIGMSLPIASNLTANNELGGAGIARTSDAVYAIYGDTANNRAHFEGVPSTLAQHFAYFTLGYRVI